MNLTPSIALILLLIPSVPFILAVILLLCRSSRFALLLAPWAALPAVLMVLFFPSELTLELPWLLLGSSLAIDQTAYVFLLFSGLLWLAAGIYSIGYFNDTKTRRHFLVWFLLAMSGNLGLIIVQDLVSYYTFFALMSFSSYGLVVFEGGDSAMRAGRIYIIMVVLGELLLFTGFVMITQSTGSQVFSIFKPLLVQSELLPWITTLVILGFGIKAGLIGLHIWLPLAHPVAPTPASAVLSGAMISAGLLGWLRILPLGEIAMPIWGGIVLLLGSIVVFYAVLMGLLQNNAKKVLAYSSISKMGIMTILLALVMLVPENKQLIMTTILFYALYHGLAKGALFLGVGLTGGNYSIKARYWLMLGLLIPALSLSGAPFTGGMMAKQLLSAHFLSIDSIWTNSLYFVILFSSFAASLLMVHFLFLVWPKKPSSCHEKNGLMLKTNGTQYTFASISMWISWWGLIIAVMLTPLLPYFNLPYNLQNLDILAALWSPVLALIIILLSRMYFPWLSKLQYDGMIKIEKWMTSKIKLLYFWALGHQKRS
jgi:formate hydrogenlyase subunit 3/multisubunit Na+/H+ antiporter MnhD subunit